MHSVPVSEIPYSLTWYSILIRANRKSDCDLDGESVGEIKKPGIADLSTSPQAGKYDNYFESYICY